MTSLALEFCASRLLGAYFGTSLFIWANLIGLILVYLTIGYFVGGRLADRYPSAQVLCVITAVAALSTALLPFISERVLAWSVTVLEQVSVSIFFSSLLITILFFSPPFSRSCVLSGVPRSPLSLSHLYSRWGRSKRSLTSSMSRSRCTTIFRLHNFLRVRGNSS